ncbi:MAG: hypothetical protein ACT6FE_01375 [Methanosarcinaceae archaeon]
MNDFELVGLLISNDLVLVTMIVLFLIGLVSVLVHWIILGKRALDRGRVRVDSMGDCIIEMGDKDDRNGERHDQ